MSILSELEAALADACDQMHRDATRLAADLTAEEDIRRPQDRPLPASAATLPRG